MSEHDETMAFGHDEIYNTDEQRIKKHLKDILPEEVYFRWIDNFVFEVIEENKILIAYYGDESLKEFKKTYQEIVFLHICSVVGYVKKIKVYKKGEERTLKKSRPSEKETKRKRNMKAAKMFLLSMIFIVITAFVAIVGASYVSNRTFREVFYTVSSLKADNRVRMIQISDLHGSEYGSGNSKLIERVRALKPDFVIFTGDCIDSSETTIDATVKFCREIGKIAPSYYIYGNNEVEKFYDIPLTQEALDKKYGYNDNNRDGAFLTDTDDALSEALEKAGVKVLKNETATLTVGTTEIDVYGVLTSNPSSFWSYGGESFNKYLYENEGRIKVTAVHEPVIFSEFTPDFWGDFSLCGHTHGGFVKVPLIGPLYTHEGGILPERKGDIVHGRYEICGRPVIVSSGLDNENFFRINNKPELTIIDINRF